MLARNLMKSGRYAEAETEFRAAIDSMPDHPLATQGLKAAQDAPRIKELGSKYTVKRMEIFNSRRADYSPMLFGDEFDQLFFLFHAQRGAGRRAERHHGHEERRHLRQREGREGTVATPPAPSTRASTPTSTRPRPPSASMDARCISRSVPQTPPIPATPRSPSASAPTQPRGKPTKLEISRDTLSSFAHPAISPDGNWLYFVSDMPGGKGGLDIWRVRITGGGLGGVENLGEPINTPWRRDVSHLPPQRRPLFLLQRPPRTGRPRHLHRQGGQGPPLPPWHPGYPLNSQATTSA